MSRGSSLPGGARLLAAVLVAVAAARCAQTPTSPSATGATLTRGAVPQDGEPTPGDSLGTVNALGATRFMAYGDSITFGTPSSFDEGFFFDPLPGSPYPTQLDNLLESSFPSQDFTIVNEGNPGELAANALASGRFAQRLAAVRPQGLLLLEGINDLNSGRSIGDVVGFTAADDRAGAALQRHRAHQHDVPDLRQHPAGDRPGAAEFRRTYRLVQQRPQRDGRQPPERLRREHVRGVRRQLRPGRRCRIGSAATGCTPPWPATRRWPRRSATPSATVSRCAARSSSSGRSGSSGRRRRTEPQRATGGADRVEPGGAPERQGHWRR